MAGRSRDKLCRVAPPHSGVQGANDGNLALVAGVITDSKPSDAMLRFVRALARAAAIADYQQETRTPDASSDNESGDLREI